MIGDGCLLYYEKLIDSTKKEPYLHWQPTYLIYCLHIWSIVWFSVQSSLSVLVTQVPLASDITKTKINCYHALSWGLWPQIVIIVYIIYPSQCIHKYPFHFGPFSRKKIHLPLKRSCFLSCRELTLSTQCIHLNKLVNYSLVSDPTVRHC